MRRLDSPPSPGAPTTNNETDAMNDKLTHASQEALQAGQTLANSAGHAEYSPLHLLAALTTDSRSAASSALERAGIDPRRVQEVARAELKRLPTVAGTQPRPGQALGPVARDQRAALGQDVDVVGLVHRDDVGLQPFDHAARLLAAAAVRLVQREHLAGGLLPVRREGRVVVLVELARHVVADVEQRLAGALRQGSNGGCHGHTGHGQQRHTTVE